jgi:hypothetical protein
MTPSAAAAPAVGTDPPTTRRQCGLSNSLALIFTRAYARHLYTCRTRLSSPSTTPYPGYGSLFRYPSANVAVSRPRR